MPANARWISAVCNPDPFEPLPLRLTTIGYCRLATGDFLEKVAQCKKDTCEDEDGPDLSVLLTALAPTCRTLGLPIPGDAISSAEAVTVTPAVSQTTAIVTHVVPTTDAGLVTITLTSTSTPTLTLTTILTVVTDKDGLIQTAEVSGYYDSATTIYGTPMIISKSTVAPTVQTVPTAVVVDSTSTTNAISPVTETVLPLTPSSSTTRSSSTVTAVVVVTAAPTVVNGSPFSSQSAASGTLTMTRLLMLGVTLVLGFQFI